MVSIKDYSSKRIFDFRREERAHPTQPLTYVTEYSPYLCAELGLPKL